MDYDAFAVVTALDGCGNSATWTLKNTGGGWDAGTKTCDIGCGGTDYVGDPIAGSKYKYTINAKDVSIGSTPNACGDSCCPEASAVECSAIDLSCVEDLDYDECKEGNVCCARASGTVTLDCVGYVQRFEWTC